MLTIYLAGPINGCADEEATGWREQVKARFAGRFSFLDPMARDYRGREGDCAAEIVEGDKQDIREADVMLVNATRPTWGTAMEVPYAWERGKRVIAFGTDRPSPWLAYHCESVLPDLASAVQYLAATERSAA